MDIEQEIPPQPPAPPGLLYGEVLDSFFVLGMFKGSFLLCPKERITHNTSAVMLGQLLLYSRNKIKIYNLEDQTTYHTVPGTRGVTNPQAPVKTVKTEMYELLDQPVFGTIQAIQKFRINRVKKQDGILMLCD